MITAAIENARMLASLIGAGEDEAAERLASTVLVTAADDAASQGWANEICALLGRTLDVSREPDDRARVELIVGQAAPRSAGRKVFAAIDAEKAMIGSDPVAVSTRPRHPLFAAVAASPAVAAALVMAIDAKGLPEVKLPLIVRFSQLGIPATALEAKLDFNGMVLVGAGAVAHGFLRALRHVVASGELPIVDPKNVGGGNPNRCLYLTDQDIGVPKAEALARNAQADFPALRLTPHIEEFRSFVEREGPQQAVVVTVDSRRVRRSIQSEVPGRVIDASTTDIRSVVVHSHRQPTQHACLSCIYRHVPDENAREQAIADGLGIDVSMVKESLISAEAAARISSLNPSVTASSIEGTAYDSLFKALCAEQALRTPEGRQVLAPFAFVSSLAGALLVIEMLRVETGAAATNYWQVDPWGEPIARLRTLRPRAEDCEFCSKPHSLHVVESLWRPFLGRRT